ncbi:MAG: lamin tail domain-containing protein [Phycisphaerae bacterium]|nr:lamin tail domain-containing protein [Phycisphaerae bacterium]
MLSCKRTPFLVIVAAGMVLAGADGLLADNPLITEFMASNDSTLLDEDGEFSDWIEIHNPAPPILNLAGWYLTDDDGDLTKWQFPIMTLAPGDYLIVFASSKDRAVPGLELHTNFKLSADGEYLALVQPDGVTVAHEFSPEFPEQRSDVSYGLYGGQEQFFAPATPGVPNNPGFAGFVADPQFSQPHGFYETPFNVTLSTASEGATIRYTIDGSAPTPANGTLYSGPIAINTTTCLRAAAFKNDWLPSYARTQTYIFLDHVLLQPPDPPGFPATWGWDQFAEPPEWTPADYAMDPFVVNNVPLYDASGPFDVKDALLAIPTISLVMDREDLFNQSPDPAIGGIYVNTWEEGVLWERPGSLEMIFPDGSAGFQVNAGVRIYGGMGRAAWAKKHTFRIFFKSDYGPTKLEYPLFGEDATGEFDTIILRANFNDGWHMLWDAWNLHRVQTIRDEWVRASQIAMGSVGSHGTFVHLYVDGLYWGLYNPVERPDASFSASYLGGDRDEWDALHDGEPIEGDTLAWEQAQQMADEGLGTNEAYQRIQGNNPDGTPNPEYDNLLDVVNLADYMLLNFHAGTQDWDYHNWYAGRRRVNSAGYKIYVWDAEISNLELEGGAELIDMDNPGHPSHLFQALRQNAEFRLLFADRVQRFFFNDGALTPANATARYEALATFVDRAIVGESARWGDAVRIPAYTRDAEWSTERNWLLYEYFPQRTAIVLDYLRFSGLYPFVEAPVFYINGSYQHGGEIQPGDALSMTAPAGTIWYTLDGSDPRLPTTTDPDLLVPPGAPWQYLDDGSDQGTAWRVGPVSWPAGRAQLGYGDGDEATVVYCGPSYPVCNSNNYITTYFRHSFTIADASQYTGMMLYLLRDDGAVVYLNGQEIARSNMEPGVPIYYYTMAWDAGETEGVWFEYPVDPVGLLVEGENILAVEVHQHSPFSSDISFDLALLAGESDPGGVSPTAIEYTGPITLSETTPVKARVLDTEQWSALNEATYTVDVPVVLYINEFMADNDSVIEDPDEPGAYEDWIEIYNPGASAVDLSGMYLTDDLADPTQYQIPAGVSIPAGGFLLFWADDDDGQGPVHTNFKLGKNGEEIGLYDTDANGNMAIDTLTFGAQTTDVSQGRVPDGGPNWAFFDDSTPGSSNSLPGDCNCDGGVSWRDIDYFIAAMNDNLAAWEALFLPGAPSCSFWNCDVNADGTVSWRDIDPFVAALREE